MVDRLQTNFTKVLHPLVLVKKVINFWNWVLVPNCKFEGTVITIIKTCLSSTRVQLGFYMVRILVGCALFGSSLGYGI